MIEEFLGVFNNLKGYIKRNKFVLSLILGVYLLVNINISLAEYPYIDDIGRQVLGYTGFSEHYSRYLSEFSARLIQGGTHFNGSWPDNKYYLSLYTNICKYDIIVCIVSIEKGYSSFSLSLNCNWNKSLVFRAFEL